MTITHGTRIPTIRTGLRLQVAREELGITQAQMAQHVGCSMRSITRYEGMASPPRAIVMAYSLATDVSLEWLETGALPGPRFVAETDEGGLYARRDSNPQPSDPYLRRAALALAA